MSNQWQRQTMASNSTISHTISLIFCFIFFTTLSLAKTPATHPRCRRTCAGEETPFPFGFSDGCPIRLNCTNDSLSINGFVLREGSISDDNFKISLPRNCTRSVDELSLLYGENFAPTSRNAILLHDCSSRHPCNLPVMNVSTRFDSTPCSDKSKVSCYNNQTSYGFLDYGKIRQTTDCKYFLSSISMKDGESGTLLDVQVLEMGWWIHGNGCSCSKGAACDKITTLQGEGFRCRCSEGMTGDGYLDGDGCRKECVFRRWFSESCGHRGRAAVIVGGIVIFLAVIAILIGICRLRRRSIRGYTRKKTTEMSEFSIPVYPYKVIARATDGFSDKQRLGNGAYGTVYAGKLNNEKWVAIKRSKDSDSGSVEQFMNEIELISSVSHPNLVQLLGCCIENGEQMLVYEFMPNGTLYEHLQREKGSGLSWGSRLAIAAETAQAIAYLHTVLDPPIYHRDIKSSNILLDWNLKPKLADFGLSRAGRAEISHISTAPQGTLGYLDPQYHQNFHLSDKSDVYSFGVVLVEIITALKVVDFARPPNAVSLAVLGADKIGKGKLGEIIDGSIDLSSDGWTLFSVNKVAELAFRCLAYDRDSRPAMKEVAAELERIRLSKPESSTNIIWSASSWEKSCGSSPSVGNEERLSSDQVSPRGNRSCRSLCSASEIAGGVLLGGENLVSTVISL